MEGYGPVGVAKASLEAVVRQIGWELGKARNYGKHYSSWHYTNQSINKDIRQTGKIGLKERKTETP